MAFAKAQIGAGTRFPLEGRRSSRSTTTTRTNLLPIARELVELGFELVATRGTAELPACAAASTAATVYKVLEGRPNVVDLMKNGEIDLIVNTPLGRDSYFDEKAMRRDGDAARRPAGHDAVRRARDGRRRSGRCARARFEVRSLQEIYAEAAENFSVPPRPRLRENGGRTISSEVDRLPWASFIERSAVAGRVSKRWI